MTFDEWLASYLKANNMVMGELLSGEKRFMRIAWDAALSNQPEARRIVERHRRHVELSPGVGEEVQKYALAVCDDILSDLPSAPTPQLHSESDK